MGIVLRKSPADRILELGGGACPKVHPKCLGGNDVNVDVRQCQDAEGRSTVDFTANFDEILPIKDEDFDGVFSMFCLEHVSWRKVKQFVGEMFRVVKPGGKAVVITANTEAQMKRVLAAEEWGDEESRIIFGDNDYVENTHRNSLSPKYAVSLFQEAGFERIITRPYGEIATDLLIEADKPSMNIQKPVILTPEAPAPAMTAEERAAHFGRAYFDFGGTYGPQGYFDFPAHEITAQQILARKPESVLELGHARGFVLKRLQDAGIIATGIDISKHCYMTRVADGMTRWDVCEIPWPIVVEPKIDLCVSVDFLDRLPESSIAAVAAEMERTCRRGLHGLDFRAREGVGDRGRVCVRPKDWWLARLPRGHEVVDKNELEVGQFPPKYFEGDGKVKLNIGSAWSQFHHGWQNLDVMDLKQFAESFRYVFKQVDARQGLPYATGGVDLLTFSHFLEHLTYREGLLFLKECRRVIKPDGAMRIAVPDACKLIACYAQDDLDLAEYGEINKECAESSPTDAVKLWSVLLAGHSAIYDAETLESMLLDAGFVGKVTQFRQSAFPYKAGCKQILAETCDFLPCLSLYVEAVPITGEEGI